MNKQRNLDDADLSKIAGGTDIVQPEQDHSVPKPPAFVPKRNRGGHGNTAVDDTPNTGGDSQFSQG